MGPLRVPRFLALRDKTGCENHFKLHIVYIYIHIRMFHYVSLFFLLLKSNPKVLGAEASIFQTTLPGLPLCFCTGIRPLQQIFGGPE